MSQANFFPHIDKRSTGVLFCKAAVNFFLKKGPLVHVFEGFFLSQIIFTTVRFASKFSVYILSLLLLTFKRLTGKYNGMRSKILQIQRKSFGGENKFLFS